MTRLLAALAGAALLAASPTALAQPRARLTIPDAYAVDPPALDPAERRSIERGAADLAGATEQSLLSMVLYLASAATLIAGVATTLVAFAELGLGRPHASPNDDAQLAALGTAIACLVAHAITTPLAITVGVDARRRHDRARRELLLGVTPAGLGLVGTF